MKLCGSVCYKALNSDFVRSCFIRQAGKIPSETQTTLTLFALPSLLFSPQSLSVSCLPNATGGTCMHTAHSIWVWTHLSTWPAQLSKCSLHAPHSFFCAITSAEWRGSEESWTHCTWEDKQDFFVKLKWMYIHNNQWLLKVKPLLPNAEFVDFFYLWFTRTFPWRSSQSNGEVTAQEVLFAIWSKSPSQTKKILLFRFPSLQIEEQIWLLQPPAVS